MFPATGWSCTALNMGEKPLLFRGPVPVFQGYSQESFFAHWMPLFHRNIHFFSTFCRPWEPLQGQPGYVDLSLGTCLFFPEGNLLDILHFPDTADGKLGPLDPFVMKGLR